MNKTVKVIYMKIKNRIVKRSAVEEIRHLQEKIQCDKVIWYLDTPTHPNMGDLAQYCCIKKWLDENYSEYMLVEISSDTIVNAEKEFLTLLEEKSPVDSFIVFQSGYCTQDLGGAHDYIHKLVVEQFKNIPIIMLPQTILYKSEERAQQVSDIYEKNHRLLILCRDTVSYEKAMNLFPYNRIMQYPDIVTSLIGTREIHPLEDRQGILICCRNDSERFYSDTEIMNLKKKLEKLDTVTVSDTTVQADYRTLKEDINGHVNRMIDDFGKYRVIVTDRYHGSIFSLIAGTPVIVIKSNDHKVVTGVDWFKGIYDESVCYIENIQFVPEKVADIYRQYVFKKLDTYFNDKYYANLKNLIEDWRQEVL